MSSEIRAESVELRVIRYKGLEAMHFLMLVLLVVFGCSDRIELREVRPEQIISLKSKGWLPDILVDTIPNLSIAYSIDTNEGCSYFPLMSGYLKKDVHLPEIKLGPEGRNLIIRLTNSYAGKAIDPTYCNIYGFGMYYIVESSGVVYIPFSSTLTAHNNKNNNAGK